MKLVVYNNSRLYKNSALRTLYNVLYMDAPMSRCAYQGCNVVPIHHLLPQMSEYRIHPMSDPQVSLEEIVFRRATELITEATLMNRRIHVKYSGGLDSMLVLLAFHTLEADYVTYLTPDAIKENTEVFKKYVARREFKHVSDPSIFDGLIVTGDGGDALFIDMLAKGPGTKYGDEALDWDWQDGFIKGMYGTKEENKYVLELLTPTLACCPWPVKTVRDFFAWTGIAVFYQHEVYRWLPTMPNVQENFHFFRPFFPTRPFIEWSLGQETKDKFPSFTDYKPTFRKFCEKIAKVELSYMRKDFSLWKTVVGGKINLGVRDDLSPATAEDIERIALFGTDGNVTQ